MIPSPMFRLPSRAAALLAALLLLASPHAVRAQDEADTQPVDTTTAKATPTQYSPDTYPNTTAGELTPGRGFDLVKTKKGSLNVSFYGLFRWINQMPGQQTFTDHLGRVRDVKERNDLNWHRTFVWLSGWFWRPEFRYTISLWSLGTTQQALIFGNLQYRVAPQLNFGVGIGPNMTARSTQGSWPYWAATDRQMAEEFFRGGFSSGAWVSGQVVPRLNYIASVNTNLSQLGTTATNDTRDVATSASLIWFPTTGEFGPRGGLGDLEVHEKLATRFGVSACHARESRYAPLNQPPNMTQIRLSDGVNPFEADALAPGVTVETLDYDYVSADAGAKLKGFSFQAEAYYRKLSNFRARGPLPLNVNQDQGFMVQAMQMVVPRTLALYATYGYVNDDFHRFPYEISAGADIYPTKSRVWRLNAHYINVFRCPTGSNFGYYTAGQSGNTVSLGTDILL